MDNTNAITAELLKDPSLTSMVELMNSNQTQEDYKSQYEALTDEFEKLKDAFTKLSEVNEDILGLYEELRDDYEDLLEDYEELQLTITNNDGINDNQSMQ